MIAAVLFDMDGTLLDSEPLWDVALTELAHGYGGTLSTAARLACVGTTMAQSIAILHDDVGQPWRDPVAASAWVERRMATLLAGGVPWRPGAAELLKLVRAAGLPTALVTSTVRRLTDVALDTLGRDAFDAVVCGDEVPAMKPHPAPYRTAATLLGVPAGECVAVEDSASGVASARAAGAAVLAVPGDAGIPAADGVLVRPTLVGADLDTLADARRLTRGR